MTTHVKVEVDGEVKFNDRTDGVTIERYYDGIRRVTIVQISQYPCNPD